MVLFATFMILLDISIVNVAIPRIQGDLGATSAQIQFVIAGYQLAYAVTLITGGRLGDVAGRKRLFIIGVGGFTLASALCGLAPTASLLVAARILQGLAAALMYPQVLSVIQVSFLPRERGTAFGIFGAVIGVATISGPLIGGLLIQADVLSLGWRPIFLVNVPVGLAAIAAAVIFLRESHSPAAPRLDLPGVALVSAGLLLLAYPLVEGRALGWPSWVLVALAGAAAVLAVFILYERWRAQHRGSPLVDLSLFGDGPFVAGSLLALLFFAGIPAFFFCLSLFLQIGLGFSALQTGVTTLPFAIGSGLASTASIRLAPRIGRAILQVGCVALIVGTLVTLAVVRLAGENLRGYQLIPSLLLAGLGLGLIVAPLVTVILAGIDRSRAGSASGVLTTVQQIGGALGIAVVGIVFFGTLAGQAHAVTAELEGSLRSRLTAAGLPDSIAGTVSETFDRCFHDRAEAADEAETPKSCPPPSTPRCSPPPVGFGAIACVTAETAATARARDYSYGFQRALVYELAVFTLTFGLVFLLPRPRPAGSPGSPRDAGVRGPAPA